MSFKGWMVKQTWYTLTMEWYWASKRSTHLDKLWGNYVEWKKLNSKDYIQYNSIYTTFLKWQICRNRGHISCCQVLGEAHGIGAWRRIQLWLYFPSLNSGTSEERRHVKLLIQSTDPETLFLLVSCPYQQLTSIYGWGRHILFVYNTLQFLLVIFLYVIDFK